jgi:CHAD domain-containing protein
VKPARVALDAGLAPAAILRRVTVVRLAEAGALANALAAGAPAGLHQFRIACKRLRYTFERCAAIDALFEPLAAHFGRLQDALGNARDCELLLAALPAPMTKTRRRLHDYQRANLAHATRLWSDALVLLAQTFRLADGQRGG